MKNLLLGIIVFMSFGLMAQNDTLACPLLCDGFFEGTKSGKVNDKYSGDLDCIGNGNNSVSSYFFGYISTLDSGQLKVEVNYIDSSEYAVVLWGPFQNDGCDLKPNNGVCITEDSIKLESNKAYILLVVNNNTISNFEDFELKLSGVKLKCPIPLPINLTSFTGENKNGLDIISWETETETNNDYFTLEYSADGKVWDEIHKVNGAGNSTTTRSYQENNRAQENDINYYRLTQIDYDGKSETFDILAIKNESVLTHVYSKKSGEILFNKIYKYELYNSMGQIILKGEDNKVNVKGLSQGVYILRTENNVQKFFIN